MLPVFPVDVLAAASLPGENRFTKSQFDSVENHVKLTVVSPPGHSSCQWQFVLCHESSG